MGSLRSKSAPPSMGFAPRRNKRERCADVRSSESRLQLAGQSTAVCEEVAEANRRRKPRRLKGGTPNCTGQLRLTDAPEPRVLCGFLAHPRWHILRTG